MIIEKNIRKTIRIIIFAILSGVTAFVAVNNGIRVFSWPSLGVPLKFEAGDLVVGKLTSPSNYFVSGDILVSIDDKTPRDKVELNKILWEKPLSETRVIEIDRGGEIILFDIKISQRFSDLNLYLRLLLSTLFFASGVYAFIKRRDDNTVRNLTYLFIFISLVVSVFSSQRPGNDLISLIIPLWWLVVYLFIPPLTLNFALQFPYKKKILIKQPYLAVALYIPTFILLPFTLNSLWLGLSSWSADDFAQFERIFWMFDIYLLSYVILAFFILFSVLRKPLKRKEKNQILWFIYGSAIGLIPFLILRKIPMLFGFAPLVSWDIILMTLFLIPISWWISIFKYHLFEIELVVNRSLVYFTVVLLFLMLYGIVIYELSILIDDFSPEKSRIFTTFAIVILAMIFEPMRRRIQYLIDKFFYRDWYSYNRTVLQLGRRLSSIANPQLLYEELVSRLVAILHLKNALFFARDMTQQADVSHFDLRAAEGVIDQEKSSRKHLSTGFDLDLSSVIMKRFVNDAAPVHIDKIWEFHQVTEDLEKVRQDLDYYNILVLVPIFSGGSLIGILCLGQKQSGAGFNFKDIELLKTLQHEVQIALHNSELTGELIESERLSVIGKMTADITHEVKNPLSSIKVIVQTMREEHASESDINKDLQVIESEIDHLKEVVNKILVHSKPDSEIVEPIKVQEIIDEVASLLANKAKRSNISLTAKDSIGDITLSLNYQSLREIIINVALNGIEAIDNSGSVSIDANYDETQNILIFTVTDTGRGIEKDKIELLCDPFYSTKKNGTGLGLATVKRKLDRIGGKLEFSTYPGNGTTVSIFVPV